jgi:hypothetical protein
MSGSRRKQPCRIGDSGSTRHSQSSVWIGSRLLDADLFFWFGSTQLQLAVDPQGSQEHGFRAVLVEKGGADLDPATLLVGGGAGDDGADVGWAPSVARSDPTGEQSCRDCARSPNDCQS